MNLYSIQHAPSGLFLSYFESDLFELNGVQVRMVFLPEPELIGTKQEVEEFLKSFEAISPGVSELLIIVRVGLNTPDSPR